GRDRRGAQGLHDLGADRGRRHCGRARLRTAERHGRGARPGQGRADQFVTGVTEDEMTTTHNPTSPRLGGTRRGRAADPAFRIAMTLCGAGVLIILAWMVSSTTLDAW